MALNIARIEATCRSNLDAIAESLNLCFNLSVSLGSGDLLDWTDPSAAMSSPGLVVEIVTPDGAIVGLIPDNLPLPAWSWKPNESQTSQLETLAAEWASLLLPEKIEASRADAKAVKDLRAALMTSRPQPESQLMEFTVQADGRTLKTAFWILATATASPFSLAEPQRASVIQASATVQTQTAPQAPPPSDPYRQRLGRVMKVPVQVVVHLADKKIEMGQLLSIAPGSLIAFDKNCEDLLDLYVNNRLYCRGEAVKIGENFGLKINELGAVKQRIERVL